MRNVDGTLAHITKEKADLLFSLFTANSTLNDQGNEPPTIPRYHSSMVEVNFFQTAVRKTLISLHVHKSSGLSGISPIVLKTRAPELALVLTRQYRNT